MLTPRERSQLALLLPFGIVIAVLFDAIFLVGVGPLPLSLSGPPVEEPGGLLPSEVELGPANASQLPDAVVFPVEFAPSGVWFQNLSLRFVNASGDPVTIGITGSVENGTAPVAVFNFTTGAWTSGGGVSVVFGELFVLGSPDVFALLGGTLELSQGPATTYYTVPY
jgi:hypothetical protein